MVVSIYDETGEFVLQYEVLDGETPEVPVGGGYFEEVIDGETYYVLGGVVTPRPTLVDDTYFSIDADGVDAVTIALPAGTSVSHDGKTYDASTAQDLVFKTHILGEWLVEIVPPFPYMQVEVTVTALAI
jgi:hypothetical protein